MNKNHSGFLSVPVAIIIAGIIIAGAIIYATKGSRDAGPVAQQPEEQAGNVLSKLKPIGAKDHIFGNPKADVVIVEFSDTECPFCKRFQDTMHQVVSEYKGKVAWVYRHFPLDSLHSKARKEAAATECANELGGNEKFWAYLDRLMDVTPSNDRLDLAELPKIAEYVGLDRAKFETCLNSGKYDKHIQEDYEDAVASGGRGTPYSVAVAKNGNKAVISGAQPVSAVKSIIDPLLK